jgi:hypothetical protein
MSISHTHQQTHHKPNTTSIVQHDPGGPAKLSTTLVHALSDVWGVDTHNAWDAASAVVSMDALDELFAPNARQSSHIAFVAGGYCVTVYNDGVIVISPPDQRPGITLGVSS